MIPECQRASAMYTVDEPLAPIILIATAATLGGSRDERQTVVHCIAGRTLSSKHAY
jgi:hypothetical protein